MATASLSTSSHLTPSSSFTLSWRMNIRPGTGGAIARYSLDDTRARDTYLLALCPSIRRLADIPRQFVLIIAAPSH